MVEVREDARRHAHAAVRPGQSLEERILSGAVRAMTSAARRSPSRWPRVAASPTPPTGSPPADLGGNEVYVDAAAMRRAGDVRTTWVRVVYARPVDVPGGEARSFEALAHFDCRAGSSAGIAVILYADEAEPRPAPYPGGERSLQPGSRGLVRGAGQRDDLPLNRLSRRCAGAQELRSQRRGVSRLWPDLSCAGRSRPPPHDPDHQAPAAVDRRSSGLSTA